VPLQIANLLAQPPPAGQPLFGADLVFIAGGTRADDRLYVPSADGNQAYAFRIDWEGKPLALTAAPGEYLPMRLFGGKGLIAGDGKAYYDDGAERWAPLMQQARARYARQAMLLSPIFDGREP